MIVYDVPDISNVKPSGGEVSEETPLSSDGYFSATQVNRQRARDEALEVLQGVVDSEAADEATKTGALLEISELAKAMEAEYQQKLRLAIEKYQRQDI